MYNRIRTRDDLLRYALVQNGEPVIQVNVAQEQLENIINEALQLFGQYHFHGQERDILTVKITQDMIDTGKVPVPEGTLSVVDMVYTPASTFSMQNLQYQMYFSDLISKTYMSNGISSYTMTRSYLSLLTDTIGDQYKRMDYVHHGGYVKVFQDWGKTGVGDYIGLEIYRVTDPDENASIWNDYWLKKYVVALVKKQWGANLSKYSIPQLAGGTTLNGVEIYQSALAEIEKLEDELIYAFQDPVGGFQG